MHRLGTFHTDRVSQGGRFAATLSVVSLLALSLGTGRAFAQEADALTHSRVTMLVTADASTPEGKGLVPTALAEARTAIQAAVRATEARGDLAQMQRYAAQVLHAIDPQLADGDGTGLGYGVRRATTAILAHAEAIAGADTRQDAVAVTPRAVAAARQVLQTAEKLTAVAQRVLAASSAADAEPLAQEMLTVAAQLVSGADQDGDGRVRAILGEGGLLLVQFSMNVLHATRNNPIREALR